MYYVSVMVYSWSPFSRAPRFFNTDTITQLLPSRCWLCSIWEYEITYWHWGSVQAVRPTGRVEVQLYPFMTTALEGGEGSASHPSCSSLPEKTWYPLYMRLGGSQGRSGQVQKISPPLEFDPWTVHTVASRYTDYATRPTYYLLRGC